MNPLTRSAIRELKTDQGVTLDALDDLEIILRIATLADIVMRVQNDLETEAILRPVFKVGSLTLRRLPIGAIDFLQTEVSAWYAIESEAALLSWALCHASAPDLTIVKECRNNQKAWSAALKAFRRGLDVSFAELADAVAYFQNRTSEADKILAKRSAAGDQEEARARGSLGAMFEILTSEYGETPEAWAWNRPLEEVELLANAYAERLEKERRKNVARGQCIASDPDSRFIRSLAALRQYLKQVAAEKKGANQ